MPPGLCFAFTVTAGCRGVSPKKLRTLLPQRDCFRFARNSPHGCAIRNGLGHKSQAGRKSKSLRCPGDAGGGSFCPAVAARAALVREGRTALLFFAARAIPVAGGGWRTLGLVRALGYADHMSTHSRSFPAPRRGALHEEQAPQEADREEKKRSAPRRRSGGKASPEQGADRQGPSFRASCFRGAGSAGSRPGQNGPGQEGGTAGTCRRGGPCPAPLAAGAPGTAARGPAAGAGAPGPSLARPAPFGPAQRRFQRAGGGA